MVDAQPPALLDRAPPPSVLLVPGHDHMRYVDAMPQAHFLLHLAHAPRECTQRREAFVARDRATPALKVTAACVDRGVLRAGTRQEEPDVQIWWKMDVLEVLRRRRGGGRGDEGSRAPVPLGLTSSAREP